MCISENNVAGKATNSFCYEFKDWRKVALYFVGKFIKGPKAGKLSCTGYFYPTLKQAKDERIKRQGNYYIDKIDLDNF